MKCGNCGHTIAVKQNKRSYPDGSSRIMSNVYHVTLNGGLTFYSKPCPVFKDGVSCNCSNPTETTAMVVKPKQELPATKEHYHFEYMTKTMQKKLKSSIMKKLREAEPLDAQEEEAFKYFKENGVIE